MKALRGIAVALLVAALSASAVGQHRDNADTVHPYQPVCGTGQGGTTYLSGYAYTSHVYSGFCNWTYATYNWINGGVLYGGGSGWVPGIQSVNVPGGWAGQVTWMAGVHNVCYNGTCGSDYLISESYFGHLLVPGMLPASLRAV